MTDLNLEELNKKIKSYQDFDTSPYTDSESKTTQIDIKPQNGTLNSKHTEDTTKELDLGDL